MKPIRNKLPIYLLVSLVILISWCTPTTRTINESYSENILINQLGYKTNAEKKALIRADVDVFELVDKKGKVVFEAPAGNFSYWELSGDSVRLADFSTFTSSGEYHICINGTEFSSPFVINENPFNRLADAVLKSYYYARCGVDITEQYGGKWNWKTGHPDTNVLIHASAADKKRPECTSISSPGGWYDAGDFGKYIVNSGISTYTLLLSERMNKTFHELQNLNIPESGNNLPDILNESLVNLKWMLSMQDPNDGGLYHKLSTKYFVGFVLPSQTNEQRYVVQKSTSATLDFAATMAYASRTFEQYNMPNLANDMKISAEKAWQWATKNPDVLYNQPKDISTGGYGDNQLKDEWFWAAAEMYLLTGDNSYKEKIVANYEKPVTPKWNVVNTLGIISLLTSDKRVEFEDFEKDFIGYADNMLAIEKESPYLISTNEFAWGSNSDIANDGMLKLIAYHLTNDQKYIASAQNDLDYILGRNATGYSFVTAFGHKTPMHIHNRISSADGIEEPVPGYLAGGPNTVVLDDCAAHNVERSLFPAKSYTDTECSYSTNETAINWNAPLVFLVSGLE
ncbi:glycoside hydrolase family 9 protein [Prolixibacteraceae bacterium Z1-6]|uniref:Endoglucanase n=1 Tax=Draconibacterium aestuarii TaxID=2998507 RepID=A0A9X3F4F0_9BACT|nr:glycoside hydrolase family 9 protein [Prolixibacteraceae bacterium Z1-6]